MTRAQLLLWLSQADLSQVRECKGETLDSLMTDGLVEYCNALVPRTDYSCVRLTDKGWAEVKSIRQAT